MSQFLRPNYSDFFGSSALPVLEEVFWSNYPTSKTIREMIFKAVKTDRDIAQVSEVGDLGMMQEVSEGQDFSFERVRQGANKTYVIKKYGLGFQISKEAIDDGKFDFVADMIAKLAKSAKETREISAVNILNNGFASTVTPDGAYLFSASHTQPSGLTFSNIPSSHVDLAVASLKAAIADFKTNFVGDTGIIYPWKPEMLVVHPDSELYAHELVKSTGLADTPNNNMNSISLAGLQVVSSPHITDTDSWFLISKDNGLRAYERKGVETSSSVNWDNETIKYKCSYREILGAASAMGIWGTTGAG